MIKPMLAAEVKDLSELTKFPLVVQKKIDGVRALWCPNRQKFFSRNGKEFRNKGLHAAFKQAMSKIVTPHMLDGELWFENKSAAETFGIVNSHIGPVADIIFTMFDVTHPDMTYTERADHLVNLTSNCIAPIESKVSVQILSGAIADNETDIMKFVKKYDPKLQWEGIMLKDPNGRYKHGRSTLKEALCIKAKFGSTLECVVADFEEGEGKAAGMVGRVKCIDPLTQKDFYVGTGMSDSHRKFFWEHRNELRMAAIVNVYHYGRYSKSQIPRTPALFEWQVPKTVSQKWIELQKQEDLARKQSKIAENCGLEPDSEL